MSGQVASRLLHLVPCILDASTQFSLAKKLRDKNRKKASSVVFCDQDNWEDRVKTEIARLIQTSREYQMPANYAHHIKWLANGDSKLAERLIILMDEEEAKIRLKHLESEFRNLRSLNCAGLRNANINHQIILPQGRVTVKIGNGLLFDFQRWVHGVFNK